MNSQLMLRDENPELLLKSDVPTPDKYNYMRVMGAERLTWTDGDDLNLFGAAGSS